MRKRKERSNGGTRKRTAECVWGGDMIILSNEQTRAHQEILYCAGTVYPMSPLASSLATP